MDRMDYFIELFGALPRAGPGDNASTRKAFEMMEYLPPERRILDVGCGPGVQTVELLRLSRGTVVALDLDSTCQDWLFSLAHPGKSTWNLSRF